MCVWIAGKHYEGLSSSCQDHVPVGIPRTSIDRRSLESHVASMHKHGFEYGLYFVVLGAFLECLFRLYSTSTVWFLIGSAKVIPPRVVTSYSDVCVLFCFSWRGERIYQFCTASERLVCTTSYVNICSLNCRGIGEYRKRKDVFNYLRALDCNIFFLQDLHCSKDKVNSFRSMWGSDVIIASHT